MIDEHLERILGPIAFDNPDGRWFAAKHKFGFVRYYDQGYREVIHKHDGEWKVSLARGDHEFSLGYKGFETTREAKEWADNRNDQELHYVECVVEKWKDNDERTAVHVQELY